jgi:hypothetical protein
MPEPDRDTVRLTLTNDVSRLAEGRDVPFPARLRRGLKYLLRSCGLKLVHIEELKSPDEAPVDSPLKET